MKKIIYSVLGLGFVFCMFSACKPVTKYEMNTTKESSTSLVTEISYPVFSNLSLVNDEINILVDNWKAKYVQSQTNWAEYDALHQENSPDSETPPFEYNFSTESLIANKHYVSILFRLWSFEGGAHGNANLVSLNYDIEAQKFVTINEVCPFSLQELSKLCYDSLYNQIEGSDDLQDWIAKGTSADDIQNFSRFTFDGKILTVYFEPYQVGPWAIGIQSVQIPVEK